MTDCNHDIGYLVNKSIKCLNCDELQEPNFYELLRNHYLTITHFKTKDKGYVKKGYDLYKKKEGAK